MTFTDIQTEIADRLNLTATASLTRIGRSINERYKWMVSSMGLDTVQTQLGITATTTIGSRELTFTCEKLLSVYNTTFDPAQVLDEASVDELRNEVQGTDPAQRYAVLRMGASTVTIFLDSTPTTQYVLTADALVNVSTLSGTNVPAFPEDFHNILVYGGMATELEKMEKYDMAKIQEGRFQQRLGELRLYIAKSAYLEIYQGKTEGTTTISLTTPLV